MKPLRVSAALLLLITMYPICSFASSSSRRDGINTADGTWQQITPVAHPTARQGDAIVWDPVSGRSLLFGGFDGGSRADFWAFDANTQQWLSTGNNAPPPARWGHSVVYDDTHKVFLYFGGFQGDTNPQGNGAYFNDVWAFSPTRRLWRQVTANGTAPSPRRGHAAIWDAANNRMIVFGGFNNTTGFFNDTWELSLATTPPTWTQLLPFNPPSGRNSSCGIYDPLRQRMVIFGGSDCCVNYAETWALDLSAVSWSLLGTTGTAPSRRTLASGAYDPLRDRMLVYGGAALPTVFGDAFSLDLATNAWTMLAPGGTPPTPRAALGSAFDATRDQWLIFGGSPNLFYSPYYDDTWVLSFGGSSAGPSRLEEKGWGLRSLNGGTELFVPSSGGSPLEVAVYTAAGRLVWKGSDAGSSDGVTSLRIPQGAIRRAGIYLVTSQQDGVTRHGRVVLAR